MARTVSTLLAPVPLLLAPAAAADPAGGPSYVESSQGLIPPTLESGRTEIEMGDIDGDGFPDLVSIGDHGSPFINTDQHGLMVWFGNAAGTWEVHQEGDFRYGGVALGDVNGDGLVDVAYGMHHAYAAGDLGDQLLEVALGDGSGTSWTPWDDGLASEGQDWGMFGTDFADVDNDGDLDVGSISFGCCDGVHVYLNEGDGSWTRSFGFLGGNSRMHFQFGDVNGDGNADLAVSHQLGTVYLGDGEGGFLPGDGNLPPPGVVGLAGISLGDADGDGGSDLAFVDDMGGIQVWGWAGPDSWRSLSGSLPQAGDWEMTQLHDMDADSHVDLVAFGAGRVTLWSGDGAGGWSEATTFTTPPDGNAEAFRVGADVDHNGFPDVVLVAEEGNFPNDVNHLRFFKEASAPASLSIAPMAPRGNAVLRAGGVAFVDWVSASPTGAPGSVGLELSTSGPGGPWEHLVEDLPNGGRFQWTLPGNLPTALEAYLRYTVAIGPDQATAVTPTAFTILGTTAIFQDGFESGDASAWSESTGD